MNGGSTGATLRSAAAAGDLSTCLRLLAGRRQVRLARDELGRTALHLAASAGHESVILALLEASTQRELDATDTAGCTALQRAAADGHEQVVRVLLSHGALIDKQDTVHGNSAVHEAGWKGYSRTVAMLAKAGANLSLTNSGGFTALHLCCQNGHNQSCRELLLAGCNPDLQNNYGDTSLHTAARYGHAGVTRILISAQCRVSDQNKNGDTALHIAAAMGRRKLTRILLEAGCDRNLRNKQNETAIDIATRKDLNEILVIFQSTKTQKESKKIKEKTNKTDKKKPHKANSSKLQFDSNKQWSPYGCHYYPDISAFPKPKLDSLPSDPLRKGEQYYLDLAGNIRKGPVGVGYTCYCAPLFRHMEEKLERDKREIKEHIDQAHARLGHRVAGLEHRTRTQIQQLSRTAAMERNKCERRHRHLEQWLTRGMAGRYSERVPTQSNHQTINTLTRSKSLELLDDAGTHVTLPPCKSMDELDVTDKKNNFKQNHISVTTFSPSQRSKQTNNSSSVKSSSTKDCSEPRRTVAEIVADLQGSSVPRLPDAQWSNYPPENSESSDDEDRPRHKHQDRLLTRDSNMSIPNYENVGSYRSLAIGSVARTRSGLYSPADRELNAHVSNLQLMEGDVIDRETNNDSGYSTKVYGSSKANSPNLVRPIEVDKVPHVQCLGASSLV